MADSEKRGRGRPKKTEAPAATKEEAKAESNDGPPPAKRGRGRPKGTVKAKPAKKASPKKPAAKAGSRGRGRPAKKEAPVEDAANSSEEAADSS